MTRPGSVPSRRRFLWLAISLTILLIPQSSCRPPGDHRTSESAGTSPFGSDAAWAPLYNDSSVSVALDTTDVEERGPNEYLVRYLTRWATPRQTEAPTPFNRELILSLLRCNPIKTKVPRTEQR